MSALDPTLDPTLGATVDELRSLIDVALEKYLPAASLWPERVHAAMRYSVFAGGKRIRPLLCLAAAQASGGPLSRSKAMAFACAVEFIHTFSLIHDDLPAMDDDELRRGRPTCHKAFDEATAILAGDALQTLAFDIIVSEERSAEERGPVLAALALLARACGTRGLIGGQMDDLKYEGIPATAEDIERIHRAKTGALIVATVMGGGILGGGSKDQVETLRAFGEPIGLAFQIVDDILDVSGDALALGKTPGKDVRSGKATWVALHGLDASRRRAKELHDQATAALRPFGSGASLLRDLADRIIQRAS